MALCRVALFPPSPGSCRMKRNHSARHARVKLDGVYRFCRFRSGSIPFGGLSSFNRVRHGCGSRLELIAGRFHSGCLMSFPTNDFRSRLLRLRSVGAE